MAEKETRLPAPLAHITVTTEDDWPGFAGDGVLVQDDRTGTGTVYAGELMRAIARVVLAPEIESALASERAKTAAAEHDANPEDDWEGLAGIEKARRLAAEATIAQVRELSESWRREGVAPDFWIELNKATAAPTAALDAALAEARAGALTAILSAAHVPTGPVGIEPNTADANYMASAASHLREGYKVGGSGVTAAVARVLDAVADELRAAEIREAQK